MNSLVDMFASDEEIAEIEAEEAREKAAVEKLRNDAQVIFDEWRAAGMSGYWNKKIYANNIVYVGNVKYEISNEHAAALKDGCGFASVEI